jgi:hypothetical protein
MADTMTTIERAYSAFNKQVTDGAWALMGRIKMDSAIHGLDVSAQGAAGGC